MKTHGELYFGSELFALGENLLQDFLYLYIHHLGVYTFIRMLNLAQGLANVLYISKMEILSQMEFVIFYFNFYIYIKNISKVCL